MKGEPCSDAADQLDTFAGRSHRLPPFSKEPPVNVQVHPKVCTQHS